MDLRSFMLRKRFFYLSKRSFYLYFNLLRNAISTEKRIRKTHSYQNQHREILLWGGGRPGSVAPRKGSNKCFSLFHKFWLPYMSHAICFVSNLIRYTDSPTFFYGFYLSGLLKVSVAQCISHFNTYTHFNS